jgi:hypothetical protein
VHECEIASSSGIRGLPDPRHFAACRRAATTGSADERMSRNWHYRSVRRPANSRLRAALQYGGPSQFALSVWGVLW